jgi:hypothetical protein
MNSERLQVLVTETTGDQVCEMMHPGITTDSNLCTNNAEGSGFCTSDMGRKLILLFKKMKF